MAGFAVSLEVAVVHMNAVNGFLKEKFDAPQAIIYVIMAVDAVIDHNLRIADRVYNRMRNREVLQCILQIMAGIAAALFRMKHIGIPVPAVIGNALHLYAVRKCFHLRRIRRYG